MIRILANSYNIILPVILYTDIYIPLVYDRDRVYMHVCIRICTTIVVSKILEIEFAQR